MSGEEKSSSFTAAHEQAPCELLGSLTYNVPHMRDDSQPPQSHQNGIILYKTVQQLAHCHSLFSNNNVSKSNQIWRHENTQQVSK